MRKNSFLRTVFVFPLAYVIFVFYTSGPPAGYTGSPGDGQSCTACHSATNNYSPQVTLTHNIPAEGYTPGATYQLTLSVSSASNKHGFQLTAENANNQRQGTFQSTSNYTQTTGNNQYIEHTSNGTSRTSWTFNWTAPSTGGGDITFYAAVNATNGDNNSTGDTPVTFQQSIHQVGIAKHTIRGIYVFPNPVKDMLYISNNNCRLITGMEIFDMNGKEVFRSDGKNEKISLQHLPAGLYLLKIHTPDETGTYQLIKE